MLIKESTLRRIIREEVQRMPREDAVGMDLVKKARDAVSTRTLPNGQKAVQSPFNDYLFNYENVFDKVTAAIAALPSDAPAGGRILTGFTEFAKSGSRSPAAESLLSLKKNSRLNPAYLARAALVIFANGKYDPNRFENELGIGLKRILGGAGLSHGDTDRKKVDAAISDPISLLNSIYAMAAFDIAGETRRVLAASQASVGAAAPAQAPAPAPAPAGATAAGRAAAPAAGAAPAEKPPAQLNDIQSWTAYIARIPGAKAVKASWDTYALSSIPPLDPDDFSLYKKWWKDYKRKNPDWRGTTPDARKALEAEAGNTNQRLGIRGQ